MSIFSEKKGFFSYRRLGCWRVMPIESIAGGSLVNCKSTNDASQGGRSCHLTHTTGSVDSLFTGTEHTDCTMGQNLNFIKSFTLIC